jgi:hypothetical protein
MKMMSKNGNKYSISLYSGQNIHLYFIFANDFKQKIENRGRYFEVVEIKDRDH